MVTAAFQATTSADSVTAQWWIEIEGIRRRYGSHVPSWASAIPDTGTNRPIRAYFEQPVGGRIVTPRFKGQEAKPLDGKTKPHEFEIRLVDISDELTALFSVHDDSCVQTYLAAAVTAAAATIDVVDSTGLVANTSHVYVNRETMFVTNIAVGGGAGGSDRLTVTRGLYESEQVAHPLTDSQGNTLQVLVADKVRFMHTREVVLHEDRAGLVEADAIKFRGYLDTVDEDLGVWVLQCSGFLKRIACRIGETLAETELIYDLWGGPNLDDGTWFPGNDLTSVTTWAMEVADESNFQSSGHVIVDEEIIEYVSKSASSGPAGEFGPLLKMIEHNEAYVRTWGESFAGRGRFSSDIWGERGAYLIARSGQTYEVPIMMKPHSAGTQVRQVMHSDDFTQGTTPAEVILQLLTSTGTGTNGTYDVLPAGWGAGIPQAKINSADIRQICWLAAPTLDLAPFCITEATDLKTWLEENVLRPLLLFFIEDADGVITVRRLWSKSEVLRYVTPTVTDHDVLYEIPGYSMGDPPIGKVLIKMNWYPGDDEYMGKVTAILGDGRERYQKVSRTHEIEIKTVYDHRVTRGRHSWRDANRGDIPDLLAAFLDPIWTNFSLNPCPQIEFEVPYNRLIDVKVGDVALLSCTVLPDLKASARGVSSEYFQIVETKPAPERTEIKCKAWMIGVHDDDTRLLAPSAKVKSYTDPSPLGAPAVRVGLEDSEFANGATVTLRGTATTLTYDVDALFVGDEVMILTPDFQAKIGGIPEEATIDAKGNGVGTCWIDLTVAPANPPAVGDYIDTARYDSCVAYQKADWAYLADANAQLGAANDDAHKRER
jgi:hypothetical protein